MKKLLWILGSLVVVAAVAIVIIGFSLGGIVKKGINTVGPRLTQSKVELTDARISAFSGKGTLRGLTIGNPTGWQTERAFYLGEIVLEVEPRSLTTEHIVINTLIIQTPEITYETRIVNSNLQDLLKNIQQAAGGSGSGTKTEPAPADTKPVKIEIRHFRMQNAKLTIAGAGNAAALELGEIALNNLGTAEGGLTPQQLTIAIMKEVTAQAIRAASQTAIGRGLLDKASEKTGEGLRKLLGGDK